MSRTAFYIALALCVVSTYAIADSRSGLTILGLDSDEEIFPEDESPSDLNESRMDEGELSPVLLAIKNQFKQILLDIGSHVLEYAMEILHHSKVQLLKKLSAYTLKDLFEAMFDGVEDFVVEASTDFSNNIKNVEPDYHGFSLASLFRRR